MDSLDKRRPSPPSPPSPPPAETWVVASTSGVNVRKSVDPTSSILGALGLGSVIEVSKEVRNGDDHRGYATCTKPGDGTWGKTEGWVNLVPCCKGTPSKWVVATSGSNLNIRKNADVNSSIMGKLPNGTKLTVTEIKKNGDYTWGFVAYAYSKANNEYWMREGWVALEYCKKA